MKIWNYMMISGFLAILFEMAGIPVASSFLNFIGINIGSGVAAFKSATFYVAVIGYLTLAGTAGIVAGFITKAKTENYVILGFIIGELLVFLAPLIGIVNQAYEIGGWVYYLTLLIMAPLILGFIAALPDHFRGLS